MNNWQVVIKTIDGEPEDEFKPTTYRQALKLERGININLNKEKYYTEIIELEVKSNEN